MSLDVQMVSLIGIGLVTGSVVGLTGASGVVVVVPLLSVLLGYSMHSAIGTSLFVDFITPLFVAWSYYKNGNVNFLSGIVVALGSIIGGLLTSRLANRVSEKTLEKLVSGVFVCLGVLMIFTSNY